MDDSSASSEESVGGNAGSKSHPDKASGKVRTLLAGLALALSIGWSSAHSLYWLV